MYSLVLLLGVRAFGFTDLRKQLPLQGPPLCTYTTTRVALYRMDCNPMRMHEVSRRVFWRAHLHTSYWNILLFIVRRFGEFHVRRR